MEVKLLKTEALELLNMHFKDNEEKYINEGEPWVEQYCADNGIKNPIISTGIVIPDIDLAEGGSEKDAENMRKLYEAMKDRVGRTLATDRRLWAYMTHVQFWKYMRSRWQVREGIYGTISDRYLFSRGLMRNAVSRFFWVAELTYDESLDNPYEYGDYMFEKQETVNQVDGSNLTRNRKILLASLKALKKEGNVPDKVVRPYYEKLNLKAGAQLFDALPEDELVKICEQTLQEVKDQKHITPGSRVTLKYDNKPGTMVVVYKKGKLYLGNSPLNNVTPSNLTRLTVGKKIRWRKTLLTIIDIEGGKK